MEKMSQQRFCQDPPTKHTLTPKQILNRHYKIKMWICIYGCDLQLCYEFLHFLIVHVPF